MYKLRQSIGSVAYKTVPQPLAEPRSSSHVSEAGEVEPSGSFAKTATIGRCRRMYARLLVRGRCHFCRSAVPPTHALIGHDPACLNRGGGGRCKRKRPRIAPGPLGVRVEARRLD